MSVSPSAYRGVGPVACVATCTIRTSSRTLASRNSTSALNRSQQDHMTEISRRCFLQLTAATNVVLAFDNLADQVLGLKDSGYGAARDSCGNTRSGHLSFSMRGSIENGALLIEKSPVFAAGTGRNESVLCRYLTMTSPRRFVARPAAVLLLATGLLSPWPAADRLLLTPPSRIA